MEDRARAVADVDWDREIELDPELRFDAAPVDAKPASVVFLTGATGFLGANLLAELSRQTRAQIVCLVRAADAAAGRERIRAQLDALELPGLDERVEVVAGDLAKPLLGMDPTIHAELARRVDRVYHVGAEINFLRPYKVLRAANVDGTRAVIELAATGRLKPLHHVSSMAVFFGRSRDRISELDEVTVDGLRTGYAQSKWVAEQLIVAARARGLAATIYRTGRISADSRTGATSSWGDLINRMLAASLTLGHYPELDIELRLTPVDFICSALVSLSLDPRARDQNVHLINPWPVRWSELIAAALACGYSVQPCTWEDWLLALKQGAGAASGHARDERESLGRLWMALASGRASFYPKLAHEVPVSGPLLAELGIACPKLGPEHIATNVRFLSEAGYLPSAPPAYHGAVLAAQPIHDGPARAIGSWLAKRAGSLSDGRREIAYAELARVLPRYEAWLDAHARGGVIWFECDNSVPGTLALLALLALGRSFVLVPPPRPGADAPAAGFCRWRLRVDASADARLDEPLDEPASLLRAEALETTASPAAKLEHGRLLLRTSGSLGAPKLVVHTHDGVLANARNAVDRLALRADDRVLIPVPVAHMFGLGAGLLPALLVGASVEVLAGANVLRYLERERSFAPTVAFSTPNLCATLVRPRPAPGHYRHMVVAGDKLSPELFAKLEAIYHRVVNLYGSTELGVICATDAREAQGPRSTTVGRALPGVELELEASDEASGEGELWCRHPHAFAGYVDAAGAPLGEAAGASAVFHTRDLARIDDEGRVELLGRCDHAVKRDGRLVALAEVERALERLPGIARAAVVVAGETRRGRGIAAFCIPVPGARVLAHELRDACRDILPAYAIPDYVVELELLPSLPSGKIDRRVLSQQLSHLQSN